MGKEEDEKEKIVPTVWDRFDKLEKQIAVLKEHNHPEIIGKKEIYNLDFINKRLEEVLRDLSLRTYNLHQAILTNVSLDKLTIGESLFKIFKELDSKPKTEKHKCTECDNEIPLNEGQCSSECFEEAQWKEKAEKKEKLENPYLDLGMITSKDGELSDYNPSQFIRDYAKTHALFNLYGLVFPEEDSGGEKDKVETNNPMSSRSGMKVSTDSKPSESEKEFEFQLVEKFIPPRNIKCSDCMNNPVPELIKNFIKIGDRIVKQIKERYGQDAKGSEYLENLFKDEFKIYEGMVVE